jgi:hypothetical protein
VHAQRRLAVTGIGPPEFDDGIGVGDRLRGERSVIVWRPSARFAHLDERATEGVARRTLHGHGRGVTCRTRRDQYDQRDRVAHASRL